MNKSTDKNSSSSEKESFSSHDSSLSSPHFHTHSSSSIHRRRSIQKNTVVNFQVKITRICVTNLPKKVDSQLTINFANFWTTTTPIVKGETSPSWALEVYTFNYSSDEANKLHNKYLVFELWSKGIKSAMIGYAQVDLHTIVAGPVAHDLPLMKKKKEAIIPVKGARIQFYVEMRCTSEAQILLSDVSCHGLRLAQNRPTPKWKNDVFLQIQLLPNSSTNLQPPRYVKSIICYNTTKPTWLELPPLTCTGTLKEILNHTLLIQVFHWTKTQPEVLGECQFLLAKYYTYNESEMCIKEVLTFQNAPFGKIHGTLVIRNLPEFAQMEGGIHNEEGVFDASPVISEAMHLNKMLIKLSLKSPVFPPAKKTSSNLKDSAPIPVSAKKIQETIRELLKKLPDDEQAAQQLAQLAESEVEICSKVFRHCAMIENLLPMLTHSNVNVAFYIAKALAAVCVNNSKNLEYIHRCNGITHLLKALALEDEKISPLVLAILRPLSIRDSQVQELFRKESAIPYLIDLLLKAKLKHTLYRIVVILGNLCYGISGGEPNNKDVIRYAGGIPTLVSLLLRKDPVLTKKILKTFGFLTQDNPENVRILLQELTQMLLNASKKTQNSEFFVSHLTTIAMFLEKSKESASLFISEAATLLAKLLASEDHQLVQLVGRLLESYSTEETDVRIASAFLSTLFLNDKKQKTVSLTQLLKLLNKPNLRKKIQDAALKENPFVPLIPLLQEKSADSNLLVLALQFLKALSISSAQIIAMFVQLGGEDTVKRIVQLIGHEDSKVQIAAVEFLVVIASDLGVQMILLKLDIFQTFKELIDHHDLIIRRNALELLQTLVYNCDIERKKLFLNTIGLDKMSQLLTTEPDIAIHAVRIIHYLCFPIAQEILEAVIQRDILKRFIALLSDPLLLVPQPHPILFAIVNVFKNLCTSEIVMQSLDEKELVNPLVKLSKLLPTFPVSNEASNVLRQLGYPGKLCTYPDKRTVPIPQQYAECKTCALVGREGICVGCAEICHRGHEVIVSQNIYSFYCNCGNTNFCNSKVLQKNPEPVNVCTFIYTDKVPRLQYTYKCNTCFVQGGKYVCLTCAKKCHSGHIVSFEGVKQIVCSCQERFSGCRARQQPNVGVPQVSNNSSNTSVSQDSEDSQLCAVCFDKAKDTLFYRCGHLVCCHECALSLKNMQQSCPICRSPIQDCVKVYKV